MDVGVLRPVKGLACVLLLFANLSCSVNALKDFADTTTDQALLEDAKTSLDNSDYSTALADIASMTSSYATSADVLRVKAAAYGGLCGFNFLTFVQAFSAIGATRLMPFLLAEFPTSSTAAIDYCVDAQNTMEAIGTISERTTNDNLFLAMISLAKIGAILSYYDGNGTATVNTNYDACTDPSPESRTQGGSISDSDAREIGSGLSLAYLNLSAVASSVNLGSGQLADMTTVCTALGANDFCSITDPTAFTATEVKAIRSLVAENSAVGIGQTQSDAPGSCPGDVTTCFCP